MPYLPGNTAQRLTELRSQRGLTQTQLSEELSKAGLGYFDRSTISRVESGEVASISSGLITSLAKYFDVTADFLLGLTDIPDKKNYELSELGLSYEAARKLLFREVDPDGLNRLIECKSFAALSTRISACCNTSMNSIYAGLNSLFGSIRSLPAHAEDMGFSLSEDARKSLEKDLDVLADPIEIQKKEAVSLFEDVMDEIVSSMRSGTDPVSMGISDDEFRRIIAGEKRKSRPSPGSGMTQEAALEAASEITLQMFHLPEEAKGLLMKLMSAVNDRIT